MIKYTGILVLYAALLVIAITGTFYILHTIGAAIRSVIHERKYNEKEKGKREGKETADH